MAIKTKFIAGLDIEAGNYFDRKTEIIPSEKYYPARFYGDTNERSFCLLEP